MIIKIIVLQKESQVYQDAKIMEEFFERLLTRWLPDYAFDQYFSDDDQPPVKKYKKIKTGEDE